MTRIAVPVWIVPKIAKACRPGAVTALLAVALLGAMHPILPARAADRHSHPARGVSLDLLFQLTTHEGRRLTREDVKGRPFLVFFGFTNCPDICPTTMQDVSTHLEALGPAAARFRAFFVTIDPERDTSEQLKTFLSSFDKRITGLTGTTIEVTAAAHAFGAYFEKVPVKDGSGYSMDHTLNVYLVDRFGLLAGAIRATDEPKKSQELLAKLARQ